MFLTVSTPLATQLVKTKPSVNQTASTVWKSRFVQSVFLPSVSSVVIKSVGSLERINDDKGAPEDEKRRTIQRESYTLAQIFTYGVIIKSAMNWALKRLKPFFKANPKHIATLLGQSSLFSWTVLIVLANLAAETVSRIFAPVQNRWLFQNSINSAPENNQHHVSIPHLNENRIPIRIRMHHFDHFLKNLNPIKNSSLNLS